MLFVQFSQADVSEPAGKGPKCIKALEVFAFWSFGRFFAFWSFEDFFQI